MQNIKRAVYSKHLLQSERLKATEKRVATLHLFQKVRTTLCAEDIQQALPEMSTSSLYRILKTLEKYELIQKANPPDDYVIPVNKRDRTFYILK